MKLPGKDEKGYWALIELWAKNYQSDGCTIVPDLFCKPACWEHDFHYRYAVTLTGEPITFEEANSRFREVIQMHSPLGRLKLGVLSPTSWVYWRGVVRGGRGIWNKHRERNLQPPPGFGGLK